ncbi:MAG: ribosome maturation factor RimM [Candidatus Cyclobacteriaceae bacterium M2_1C_046]
MNIDACFELGYVIKKHGLKGGVSIYIDADEPENYINLESVFVEIDQKLIPFFIEEFSLLGDKAYVKFEDIDSVEEAEELKGSRLFLPLEALPPLEGNQFYYHEIIGYKVNEQDAGDIGVVKDVFETTAQDLLFVDHNGKEILIPIDDDIIIKVEHTEKMLYVSLPEGLLDIYLE